MFRPQCSRNSSCRPCSVLPAADLVVCYPCKSWNETSIVRRNCRVSRMFWGTGNSVTAASSFGFVLRPCRVITWPRYSTSVRMKYIPAGLVVCYLQGAPSLYIEYGAASFLCVCVCERERVGHVYIEDRRRERVRQR